MSQSPTEQEIIATLEVLNGDRARRREAAIQKLTGPLMGDERIVSTLESLAAGDAYQYVRDAAGDALIRIGRTPPVSRVPPPPPIGHVYSTRSERILDVVIGFVGWWVVNVGIWLVAEYLRPASGYARSSYGWLLMMLAGVLFIINIATLILLAFLRRWVALGILTALGANSLIALVTGLSLNASCGIAFLFDARKW